MQNQQERFISLLSERSFGIEFVFEPDEWSKGNQATREPADLIWACNNCIVLMYMRHRDRNPNPVIHAQRRQKIVQHNLKQASGWLREWRSGRLLTGQNRFHKFAIPYDAYRYIVILSVVDAGDCEGEYHHVETIKLGITMCATIPQSALEELARVGGGIIDLLFLLNSLRTKGVKLRQANTDALGVVMALHKTAIEQADPDRRWLTGDADEDTVRVQTYLRGLRLATPTTIDNPETMSSLNSIFNDMPLWDLLSLVVELRSRIEDIGENYTLCIIQEIKLSSYHIVLGLASHANLQELIEPTEQLAHSLSIDGSGAGIPIIVYETYMGVPIIAYKDRIGPSFTERIINFWLSPTTMIST